VTGLAPGDRVVLTPAPPCGTCYWCVRNEHALCVNSDEIMTSTFADGSTGLARRGQMVYRGLGVGGFAEQVITHATGAVKIPSDVPTEIACVIGCAVQTGVGAVLNTARVEEGATVLVMGAGGIGLSIVQGARLAGAAAVIVSDPVAGRRDVAAKLGATHLIDPGSDDVVERARALTSGIGVDYAFDAAGAAALVHAGLQATRKGRHHGDGRRGADHATRHDPGGGAVRRAGEEADRLHPRQLQLAARCAAHGLALARGQARPRGHDQRALSACAHQRRARRAARTPRRAPRGGVLTRSYTGE
jgi:D-arabinose 1-dehydrogenase-like Zn-dependent alcohol dehydrogenase